MKKYLEGDKILVIEEFNTLCCMFPRKVGEELVFLNQSSKNRAFVEGEVGIHKVKLSTLRRCTKEIE